jgi:hypothetical protein
VCGQTLALPPGLSVPPHRAPGEQSACPGTGSTVPAPPATRDLRKQAIDEVLNYVESGLGVRLDRQTVVRKRRSVGGCSDRGTWVCIEARPVAKIETQGQAGNGMEVVGLLRGVARPAWYRALCWHDSPERAVGRVDQVPSGRSHR